MPKSARQPSANIVENLNRLLQLDDPMSFQKLLMDIALSTHGLESIAEHAGVRRQTVWRYRSGANQARFETLVKIIALIGGKLVIVADETS
jgi:DNA-binding phage protein